MNTTLYIKHMVCIRCKMAVEAVLQSLHIPFKSVQLGKALLTSPLTLSQKEEVAEGLAYYHLELMEDRNTILVERPT